MDVFLFKKKTNGFTKRKLNEFGLF